MKNFKLTEEDARAFTNALEDTSTIDNEKFLNAVRKHKEMVELDTEGQ